MRCALCDRDAEHLVGPDLSNPHGPWVGFCTNDASAVVDVLVTLVYPWVTTDDFAEWLDDLRLDAAFAEDEL